MGRIDDQTLPPSCKLFGPLPNSVYDVDSTGASKKARRRRSASLDFAGLSNGKVFADASSRVYGPLPSNAYVQPFASYSAAREIDFDAMFGHCSPAVDGDEVFAPMPLAAVNCSGADSTRLRMFGSLPKSEYLAKGRLTSSRAAARSAGLLSTTASAPDFAVPYDPRAFDLGIGVMSPRIFSPSSAEALSDTETFVPPTQAALPSSGSTRLRMFGSLPKPQYSTTTTSVTNGAGLFGGVDGDRVKNRLGALRGHFQGSPIHSPRRALVQTQRSPWSQFDVGDRLHETLDPLSARPRFARYEWSSDWPHSESSAGPDRSALFLPTSPRRVFGPLPVYA